MKRNIKMVIKIHLEFAWSNCAFQDTKTPKLFDNPLHRKQSPITMVTHAPNRTNHEVSGKLQPSVVN